MMNLDEWLSLVVVGFTLFSVFLLTLPSPCGAESRFRNGFSQDELRVQVVVLGDIGRSPRIQYHAISIAKHGGFVDLIGYIGTIPSYLIRPHLLTWREDSALHPDIRANPNITVHGISKTPDILKTNSKWLFVILGPLKVLLQTCSLYFVLGYRTAPAKFLLVQVSHRRLCTHLSLKRNRIPQPSRHSSSHSSSASFGILD